MVLPSSPLMLRPPCGRRLGGEKPRQFVIGNSVLNVTFPIRRHRSQFELADLVVIATLVTTTAMDVVSAVGGAV